MEADAPVDEVDALAARIDAIDDLDAGNHLYGCGRVLTALIRDADVEGVRAHLELLDYHDEDAVSAHQLAMAARLPYKVHYADAAVCRRSREVLSGAAARSFRRLISAFAGETCLMRSRCSISSRGTAMWTQ